MTIEELSRLFPDLEELEELRLSLLGAASPDPSKAWARSSVLSTVDKRIVTLDRVEGVVAEAEAAFHEYIRTIFSAFRPVYRAFFAGGDAEAARHLVELGERQEGFGRYHKARQCFEAALGLALPLPDRGPQILALRRIGRVAQALGDLYQALQFYHRSAELAHDVQDLRGEVIARTGSGNVLSVQGRWAEAERCYRGALECLSADTEAFALERAQLYNNLGMVATRQNHVGAAETWFEQALQLWTVIPSPTDLAVCWFNQAMLQERQGRREEARRLYEQALTLDIPPSLRAGITIELADLHLKQGRLGEAERCGRVAEEYAIAARSPYYLAEMYRGLGNIAREQGDDDGFTFYEKALEIARKKEYLLLEGEILMEYAILRGRHGGREEAQAYLERANEIFAALGAVHEQDRVATLMELTTPVPDHDSARASSL